LGRERVLSQTSGVPSRDSLNSPCFTKSFYSGVGGINTAAVLANGSVLVIGGETGSNGPPQPNLEILPKPAGGDTVVTLDWLTRTDPNNLYPFVVVLPSKNILSVRQLFQ